ncbi:MAG: lipid-A-disaccharide synthase [Candidatus Poribacteria bacterium]
MDNPKIMLVAGEASGDLHCARLASKLKELCPSVMLFGMGGKLMSEADVEINYDISDLSVMGITEVLGKLPIILKRLKSLKSLMEEHKPDAVVFVDFPDFNMRLLPFAYKKRIPIIYYIPPKAWAWRKKRAYTIAKYTSAVASIFPFEAKIYKSAGANVHYVGHPLLDFSKPSMSKEETLEKFNISSDKPIIGLMPGSRKKEVKRLLQIMIDSAKMIKAEIKDCQFILPVAHTIPRDMIPQISDPPITLVDSTDVYNMMSITDLIIMASGTATLEATFSLAPMIVIYKVSFLSWIVMKNLVNPNIKSTALPNIIADKEIVPELLQSKADAKNIAKIAVRLLKNPNELEDQRKELKKVIDQLGERGAVERTAKLILNIIESKNS